MLILQTLLLACAAMAHAAPMRLTSRSLDVDSRDIDTPDFDLRDLNTFEDISVRAFDGLDRAVVQARGLPDPKFAQATEKEKQAGLALVNSASEGQLQDAAAPSTSSKTLLTHELGDDTVRLDRQQRSNARSAGKAAVQLGQKNKKGHSTIGQVVVPNGTTPDPKTVRARLKHSINTGKEQSLPNQSKQDRKAANIAQNEAAKKAKKASNAAKQQAGVARVKATGDYKKGKH